MQIKAIVWTIVVLVLLALAIWGISSWSGDDGAGNDNGGSSITGSEEGDVDTLINGELIGENDSIELGDVV